MGWEVVYYNHKEQTNRPKAGKENNVKQYLYSVGMKHKKTGQKIDLMVWAENVDEATHKVTGAIGGYRDEYSWTGSGPEYENNELVTREI